MTKLVTELKISDFPEFKSLISVLGDNMDNLPKEVASAVSALSGSAIVTWSDLEKKGYKHDSCEILADGVDLPRFHSYNKITREVMVIADNPTRIVATKPKCLEVKLMGDYQDGWH